MSIFRGAADINPYPSTGFAVDPSVLVQLTNLDFRGVLGSPSATWNDPSPSYVPGKEKVHPNFIDRGWFPIMVRGNSAANVLEVGTNVVAAVKSAIQALADPALCPSGAQKSVVIATDGIATCAPGHAGSLCGIDYSYFQDAESQLISGPNSVLADLRRRKIALTTILAGGDVGANVMNRFDGTHFLNYREAVATGKRGLTDGGGGFLSGNPAADSSLFVDSRASCGGGACPEYAGPGGVGRTPEERQNEYAFLNLNGPGGIVFRRPNGLFAHLSIESGGVFCPLLPTGSPAQYEDHDGDPATPRRLKDSERMPDQILTIAESEVNAGEIAAECVRQTLGGNPFALVEE